MRAVASFARSPRFTVTVASQMVHANCPIAIGSESQGAAQPPSKTAETAMSKMIPHADSIKHFLVLLDVRCPTERIPGLWIEGRSDVSEDPSACEHLLRQLRTSKKGHRVANSRARIEVVAGDGPRDPLGTVPFGRSVSPGLKVAHACEFLCKCNRGPLVPLVVSKDQKVVQDPASECCAVAHLFAFSLDFVRRCGRLHRAVEVQFRK